VSAGPVEHAPRVRTVVTTEGVELPFEVASVFDRIAALVTDLLLAHLAVLLVLVAGFGLAGAGFGVHVLALTFVTSFLVRNFYFAFFEIRGGGATPGKSRMGIRVISRSGGPLTADAVLARNLTREFEVFLPLMLLASPQALLPSMPAGMALLGGAWLLVGALLPLFNRDRLRLGDLLGGTIVVALPRTALLEDPAAPTAFAPAAPTQAFTFTFSAEQLDQYGIEELQVLEDLVRRADSPVERGALVAVARTIRHKIGWPVPLRAAEVRPFLGDFYRQLRARLENKALFGVRQLKKKAGRLGRTLEPPSEPDPPDG